MDPSRPTRNPTSIGRIVETPGILGGRPRIDGTRIPTTAIWNFHEDGAALEEILREYPRLTAEDVRVALEFEAARRRQSA